MNEMSEPRATRRATNVTCPEDLVKQARGYRVRLSQACEDDLRMAVADARREAWLREARPGMDEFNDDVAKHGTLLARYRQS